MGKILFLFCLAANFQFLCAEQNLTPVPNYQERLQQLEARINRELTLLDYPARP